MKQRKKKYSNGKGNSNNDDVDNNTPLVNLSSYKHIYVM